jgi:hypothetical protein
VQEGKAVAANKRDKKHGFVPKALWGKFPNSWIPMLEKGTRVALEVTMILVSFCALYATLLGPPHRSEWVYLLTASLGPAVVAIWYIIFPFNPYQSMSAIREGMKALDQSDQDAKTLVALLKSSEAHHFLLKKAWKLSLLLFAPMAIISAAMQTMPIWRFGADCLIRIAIFLVVCLFVLFRIELLYWALQRWKGYGEEHQAFE